MEEDLKSLGRTLVAAANALVAVAAGAYFALDWLGHAPEVSKGLLALIGSGVVLLNLIRLLYFRAGRRKDVEGPLLSHTDYGVVHVSREAVESGLRAAGEALDEVTRLRVKVLTPARRRMLLRAHYMAPDGVPILELSSRLRQTLLERFRKLVQLERDARLEIEMIFEGFYGKVRTKGSEPEPPAPPATESEVPPPFTGPRYPIDVEGESI